MRRVSGEIVPRAQAAESAQHHSDGVRHPAGARALARRLPEETPQVSVTPSEHCLEDDSMQRRSPGKARHKTDAIGNAATWRLGLNDALVLPHSLSQQRGSLQKAPPGLDLFECQVVVFDRKNATNEEPAAEEALSGLPPGREITDTRREGHAE